MGDLTGSTILQFEILELLGRGAMGEVYKARDTQLNTIRALKFLRPGLSSLPEARAGLIKEAQNQSQLIHQNVAAILNLREVEDKIFLVMEYVDGVTLDKYLAENNPTTKERFELILQITYALEAAHQKGILHRDIKPRNVLVTKDGTVKVTDFGLAKTIGETTITVSGGLKGTAAYMAPELFRGESSGKASDIWSLGVLIYEVFEGVTLFQGETFEAIGYQIINEDIPALTSKVEEELPGITEFLLKCLDKEPTTRIQNGAFAFATLREIAQGAGLEFIAPRAASQTMPSRIRKLLGGNVLLLLSGCVILVGLLLIFLSQPIRYTQRNTLSDLRTYSWNSVRGSLAFAVESGQSSALQLTNPCDSTATAVRLNTAGTDNVRTLSWAPNGTWLAIIDTDGKLFISNQERGYEATTHQVGSFAVDELSWSSDSQWLVGNTTWGDGAYQPFIVGPISTISESLGSLHPTPVTINDSGELEQNRRILHPIFILEDSHILYELHLGAINHGLHMVSVNGGGEELVIAGALEPRFPSWDPQMGALVFYSGLDSTIYRQQFHKNGRRKGRPKPLCRDLEGSLRDMQFNPGNGMIAVSVSGSHHSLLEFPFDSDGGLRGDFNSYDYNIRCPMITRDNARLYYNRPKMSTGPGLGFRNLGTQLDSTFFSNQLLTDEWFPAPDPYGVYVAFLASTGRSRQSRRDAIVVYRHQTEDHDTIPIDAEDIMFPIWSHDGRKLYFTANRLNNELTWGIYCIDVERTPPTIWSYSEPELVYSDSTSQTLGACLPGPQGHYLIIAAVDADLRYTITVLDQTNDDTDVLVTGQMPTLSSDGQDLYFM